MQMLIEQLSEDLALGAKAIRRVGDIRAARQVRHARLMDHYKDPKKVEEIEKEYLASVDKILDRP